MSAKRKGPRLRKLSPAGKARLSVPSSRTVKPTKVLGPVAKQLRPVFKLIGFVIPPYFKNSWSELRQVTWPGRGETWKLTSAVFIFAIVFGGAVLLVDKGLDDFFKKVILK